MPRLLLPTRPSMKTTRDCSFMALVIAAVVLVHGHAAGAAMVAVTSATNDAGIYRYHVTRSSDPFRLGGSSTMLSFAVRAYHVESVAAPPGWVGSLTNNTVTWQCTNTGMAVIDTNELVFRLSSGIGAILYDSLAGDAIYPCGICAGEVIATNGVPLTALQDDYVGTVNMAAYERFAHLGPLVPEPAAGLLVLMLAALPRRRATAGIGRIEGWKNGAGAAAAAAWPHCSGASIYPL